jgi:hypothetical protein
MDICPQTMSMSMPPCSLKLSNGDANNNIPTSQSDKAAPANVKIPKAIFIMHSISVAEKYEFSWVSDLNQLT